MEGRRVRIGIVAAVLSGGVATSVAATGAAVSPADAHPLLTVSPRVVRLQETASVEVRGLAEQRGVEVRLRGATAPSGKLLSWLRLRREHGVWRANLPQVEWRGIYPIDVRTKEARAALTDDRWYLRVFPAGTLSRPSFPTPTQAVNWWVQTVAHAQPEAVRPWRLPPYDHRDPQLHRMFVVAYTPPGDANPDDRRGMWVTTVRDGYHGRWRFLEAAVRP